MKVVIVDDNKGSLAMLKARIIAELKRRGRGDVQVIAIGERTVGEALPKILEERPDVVFLDLQFDGDAEKGGEWAKTRTGRWIAAQLERKMQPVPRMATHNRRKPEEAVKPFEGTKVTECFGAEDASFDFPGMVDFILRA
jgi:DNA-binding LytR/AlgR family response regulator